MLDPFPFRPPPLLGLLTKRIAPYFGLTTLQFHIHEVLGVFLLYHFICLYISPILSNAVIPSTYKKFPRRTKIGWDVHVTSFFQCMLVNIVCLYIMRYDQERKDMDFRERIWGYTGGCGLVAALATGYFLWDLWVSYVHLDVFGPGMLAHAVSALCVYILGFVSLPICRYSLTLAAAFCQLLRAELPPLRTIQPFPQYTLVPRQAGQDGVQHAACQWHLLDELLLLRAHHMGQLYVLVRLQ